MDEYAALAQRVVLTMDDVRGCLVLSRDGMVLGAYPEEDEQAFKPARLKFVHAGEPRRGFAELADRLRPATFSDPEPVTPAGRPAAFATEGSACSRLEAEQAASAAAAPLEEQPLIADGSAGPATRGPDEAAPTEGEPATPFRREPQRLVSAERAPDEPEKVTEEPGEVDRVMLAKEFSGLLQLNEDGDEDNS